MPTVRGFVQRIEIGRAGLVTVSLVHADGSPGQYVISDLDADPERFNERLSKLGVLRDAMTRAEPVEVEHVEGAGGREIDRAARISRDALRPPRNLEQLTGLVLDVSVTAHNGADAAGEVHDSALVVLLTTSMVPRVLVLDLQAPERLVADAQLGMLRDAHGDGRLVRLMVEAGGSTGGTTTVGGIRDGAPNTVDVGANAEQARIVAVAADSSGDVFGGDEAMEVNGFVESLSLLRLPGGSSSVLGTFAHVRLTTAPPFTGAGNVVAQTAFTPEPVDLLTPKGSLAYQLFEAGLRDGLRVRASAALAGGRKAPGGVARPIDGGQTPAVIRKMAGGESTESTAPKNADASTTGGREDAPANAIGLAFGVELLAPLASASRPVWVAIERSQLDLGPESDRCVLGSPSSDLTPRGMRDLRLPYPARWCGHGCFNAGVYRFQVRLASDYTVTVDGEEICLHDAGGGVKLGHACIEGGCHEVCVAIEEWTCDSDFVMDVYRLR